MERIRGRIPTEDFPKNFDISTLVESIFSSTEGNSTSSIGPTFPPEISSFQRIKGFDNRFIVTSKDQITDYINLFEKIIPKMDEKISRLSFRFIADNRIISNSLDLLARFGEVVIPLQGAGDGFDDTSIVYFGYNLPGLRESHLKDRDIIQNNVKQAIQVESKTYEDIMDRIFEAGYVIESPNIAQRTYDVDFRAQMIQLYSRFNWSPEAVLAILENSESIFVSIRHGNTIVSAGLVEKAEINVGSQNGQKTLRIAELTEAATLNEYQSNGLYTAVAAELLRLVALLPEQEKIHLVLGESNGLAVGVLKAAKRLGRTLATEVVDQYSLPIAGMLPQHVAIDGPERRTKMNDLVPAFITASEIQRLYSKTLEKDEKKIT